MRTSTKQRALEEAKFEKWRYQKYINGGGGRPPPPPRLSVLEPTYCSGQTCDECWEPYLCGWWHKLWWGHKPPLTQREREWQEWQKSKEG